MKPLIDIVPYDPHWPEEFRRVARPLRAALGDRALRIDHIGSTAVPDLAAKDVIDVQVTTAALETEAFIAAVAPLGYTLLWGGIVSDHAPPGWQGAPEEWHKLFFRGPAGQRRTNLHIRREGRANQRYALLFRDYLRAQPQAAGAYRQIKEALARLHPDDADAYYDVKDPVCDVIMTAAELWAVQTSYALGPSDA